jgi:hypothetical protein
MCNLLNPPAILSQSPASVESDSGGGTGGTANSSVSTSTWIMLAIIGTLGLITFMAVKK